VSRRPREREAFIRSKIVISPIGIPMMKDAPETDLSPFDDAAAAVVELGNRLLDQDKDADPWDVASGILAGAIQYWLYAHQPCADPYCESCAEVSTAEQRMKLMQEEIKEFAEESDYFHTPTDSNAGRA
jgi:ubiquinone biosynthesis protein UbiJ